MNQMWSSRGPAVGSSDWLDVSPVIGAKHTSQNGIKVRAALKNLPLSINLLQREEAVIASVVCSDVRGVDEQKTLVAALNGTQANDGLVRAVRHKTSNLLTVGLRE